MHTNSSLPMPSIARSTKKSLMAIKFTQNRPFWCRYTLISSAEGRFAAGVVQRFPRRRIRAKPHALCILTTADKRKDQLGYFVCFKFITKLATLSLHLLLPGFTFLLSFVPISSCLRNKRTSRCARGDVMKSLVKVGRLESPTVLCLLLCICNGFFVDRF